MSYNPFFKEGIFFDLLNCAPISAILTYREKLKNLKNMEDNEIVLY